MSSMIEGYVDKIVQVVTNDGRNLVGVLKGFDQKTNVILDECHERVYSSEAGVEQVRARGEENTGKRQSHQPRHACALAFAGRPRALYCARR